jgi:hypothetical protein
MELGTTVARQQAMVMRCVYSGPWIMQEERRALHRSRTYLAARIAFNDRYCTASCLVRNMSQNGAKLVFSAAALIPNEFDVIIPDKGESRRGRIVWRNYLEAGIAFLETKRATVVSIESALRTNKLKAERDALKARLADLKDPII